MAWLIISTIIVFITAFTSSHIFFKWLDTKNAHSVKQEVADMETEHKDTKQ